MIVIDKKRTLRIRSHASPQELESEKEHVRSVNEEIKRGLQEVRVKLAGDKDRVRGVHRQNIERVKQERKKVKERIPQLTVKGSAAQRPPRT